MPSNLFHENFLSKVQTSSRILDAVDHKIRQRIIDLISSNYNTLSLECLLDRLEMDESFVQPHLEILKRYDILFSEKQDRQIFYSLNYDRIGQISTFVTEINQY